jgi:DNA-binding NarL/FixJ family response regulator
MRVALADDSLLVREGIRMILEGEPGIELVAVCEDRDALLGAVDAERPDVVVTDIRMPPSHRDEGIEIAHRLRDAHPETGVIVLSQFAEADYALRLLARGSERRGYLLKERLADRAQLVAALRIVDEGGSVVDPKIVDELVRAQSARATSPLRRLTPREHEILAELASGKSNQAIAQSLVITKRAVERHITAIFSKLDLPDEAEVSRRVTATLLFLADSRPPAA